MTEVEQIQAILDGAQAVANGLSLAGDHLGAARVVALIQLTRALRSQAAAAEPQEATE